MPTSPSERFEFASEAWVQAARQSLETGLKGTVDVPKDGFRRLAWASAIFRS